MSGRGKDNGRDELLKFAPKHVTKQEFGRRVYQAMIAKGLTQSELARQSGITRDKISTYIRGKTMPTVQNAERVAKALGVERESLLPNTMEVSVDRDDPDLEIKRNPGMPSHMTWLRVNRAISLRTALKIAELIENDNAPDPDGNSNVAPLFADKG